MMPTNCQGHVSQPDPWASQGKLANKLVRKLVRKLASKLAARTLPVQVSKRQLPLPLKLRHKPLQVKASLSVIHASPKPQQNRVGV